MPITISLIIRLQLTIREMTSSLIVSLFLQIYGIHSFKKTWNLGLLYPTCFQSLYHPAQLIAITEGSQSRHMATSNFPTLLQISLTLGPAFLTK
jgi:hypothetical protein